MPELNANIPATEAFVRGNFLRNQQDSHDLYFPCIIFGVGSLPDRVPVFHFLMEDGGIWWRMPISAFCQAPNTPQMDLHDLVLWNSFSPHITVTKFEALDGMRMTYKDRHRNEHKGKYLFTLDWHQPDHNLLDSGYSENWGQHKCGHVIALDNGNFAIQPNNRVRLFDPSFTVKTQPVIDRILNTHPFAVEDATKWVSEDSDRYDYDIIKR